jgi:hypothetical protein
MSSFNAESDGLISFAAALAGDRYLAEDILSDAADIRDPAGVLANQAVQPALDLSQPTCVIMAAVSHLLPAAQVAEITAGYMRAMPAGSWLVLSAEVASFLGMLDVIGPGIAEASRWVSGRAGVPADAPAYVLCAAGIKMP